MYALALECVVAMGAQGFGWLDGRAIDMIGQAKIHHMASDGIPPLRDVPPTDELGNRGWDVISHSNNVRCKLMLDVAMNIERPNEWMGVRYSERDRDRDWPAARDGVLICTLLKRERSYLKTTLSTLLSNKKVHSSNRRCTGNSCKSLE